jgi:hypothetical protein
MPRQRVRARPLRPRCPPETAPAIAAFTSVKRWSRLSSTPACASTPSPAMSPSPVSRETPEAVFANALSLPSISPSSLRACEEPRACSGGGKKSAARGGRGSGRDPRRRGSRARDEIRDAPRTREAFARTGRGAGRVGWSRRRRGVPSAHLSPEVFPRASRHRHLTHCSASARVLHARAPAKCQGNLAKRAGFSSISKPKDVRVLRPATVRPTAARVAHASPDAHARATGSRVPRRRARRVVPCLRPALRARVARPPPRPPLETASRRATGSRRPRDRSRQHPPRPRESRERRRAARRDRDVRRLGVRVRGGRPPVPRPGLRHERRALRGGGRARRRGGGDEREVSPHRGRRHGRRRRPRGRLGGGLARRALVPPRPALGNYARARGVHSGGRHFGNRARRARRRRGSRVPPHAVQRAARRRRRRRRVVRAGGAHHAQRQLGAVQAAQLVVRDGRWARGERERGGPPGTERPPCPTRVCCTTRIGWRFCCTARWA